MYAHPCSWSLAFEDPFKQKLVPNWPSERDSRSEFWAFEANSEVMRHCLSPRALAFPEVIGYTLRHE
jgi:hypothetical protein